MHKSICDNYVISNSLVVYLNLLIDITAMTHCYEFIACKDDNNTIKYVIT